MDPHTLRKLHLGTARKLMDEIAVTAMQELLRLGDFDADYQAEKIAHTSYKLAQEMIEVRVKYQTRLTHMIADGDY